MKRPILKYITNRLPVSNLISPCSNRLKAHESTECICILWCPRITLPQCCFLVVLNPNCRNDRNCYPSLNNFKELFEPLYSLIFFPIFELFLPVLVIHHMEERDTCLLQGLIPF